MFTDTDAAFAVTVTVTVTVSAIPHRYAVNLYVQLTLIHHLHLMSLKITAFMALWITSMCTYLVIHAHTHTQMSCVLWIQPQTWINYLSTALFLLMLLYLLVVVRVMNGRSKISSIDTTILHNEFHIAVATFTENAIERCNRICSKLQHMLGMVNNDDLWSTISIHNGTMGLDSVYFMRWWQRTQEKYINRLLFVTTHHVPCGIHRELYFF